MQLAHHAAAVRAATAGGGSVLVPTMGGLHAGHLSLVRQARRLADTVIVSIYVNPLQFGANEDFSLYPRRLQQDCDRLQGLADIVYAPADSEMYPDTQTVGITLPPLAEQFCGKSRPGFFQGVAVVVCKLFNQCRPDAAIFGRKDYQQAILVRLMTRQLNMGVHIDLQPIVRADDGLALSSRNEYLDADERRRAPRLYAALRQAAAQLQQGERDYDMITAAASAALNADGFQMDYFAIRAAADLGMPPSDGSDLTILAAATLGTTRLIDNLTLTADGALI